MNLTEKAAYIKGLFEGIKLDDSKEETKVLKSIVDLLEDMALSIRDLENIIYDCNCEDSDCGCCDCDSDLYEVCCPNCGEKLEFGFEDISDASSVD